MRNLRRPAAAAAATALLLALTACGGGDDESAGSGSDETSQTSDGESLEEGEEVEPGEFVDDMMAGLEASTTAQMTMSVDSSQGPLEAEGEVDYTTDPVSMHMSMSNEMMGDEPIEMRLVDGVMYMNMGAMSNGKYISYDLSDTENLPPGMAGLTEQMDPLGAFKEFEPALKSVTYVGEEEVDGEELAHYDVVLDTTKMESLQSIPGSSDVPPEMAYDLYFDDEFRVRQMDMAMEMGASPVEVTVTLSEWGEPVEIEAPPAAEVVDPTQLSG